MKMKRSYIGLALSALVMVGAVLSLPSCGNQKKLVSLQVQPGLATYPSPDSSSVDFSAIGTFIHPPSTQNLTTTVTWSTDVPELLTLNVGGVAGAVAPSGAGCGIADIIATAKEGTGGSANIVIGRATVTVQDITNPLCPGGSASQAVVTVTLNPPTGSGSVTSVPTGITCPGTACGALFTVGNTIALLATPASGHTFVGWTGACTTTANTCSILVPTGGTNATATFN
jgi:uncharacterized repeat protein (TIGR02543 family)